MTEQDPDIYVMNAITSRDTRIARLALDRAQRTQRVLTVLGVTLHPNRRATFRRSKLLEHRSELEELEKQGKILLFRTNMTRISMADGLLPIRSNVRGLPELPTDKLPPPPGDMPAESMGPPPEGGFNRVQPRSWDASSSPKVMDSIQKLVAEGILRRRPSSEGIIPAPEAPAAAAKKTEEASPAPEDSGWLAIHEKEPEPAPNPPPLFRKGPKIDETEEVDPFAPEDYG